MVVEKVFQRFLALGLCMIRLFCIEKRWIHFISVTNQLVSMAAHTSAVNFHTNPTEVLKKTENMSLALSTSD